MVTIGKTVAAGSNTGEINIFDIAKGPCALVPVCLCAGEPVCPMHAGPPSEMCRKRREDTHSNMSRRLPPPGRRPLYVPMGYHAIFLQCYDVTMWDARDTGQKIVQLNPRGKFCMSVAYSYDGKRIAGGAIDGTVTVFDLTTGKHGSVLQQIASAHEMPVR